jgi:serine/threonine protein kinase
MEESLAPEDLLDADGAPTADTLTRGTRLGRYELLLPVALGGMAKVWAARQHGHRGFTKLVAIKTILPHLAQDRAFEHMFLDEARIAAGVHHPNVTEIYELGEEGRVLYLAMEWVSGDSLVRVLRSSAGGTPASAAGRTTALPLDLRVAARIVADACAGLHAAHELVDDTGRVLSVVHRDMSPHNILLTAEGHVKVTDFGVAKAMGQLHDVTTSGTIKGKISYMAPEQVTGTHIDRRTDVFGLGCVLYEATTGKLPYRDRGENDAQVMHRLIKGQALPPSKVVRGYPPELEAIVMRALASQPIQRFASAERMRVAIEEWLAKSGPIVTAAHVTTAIRARIGPEMDKRRDRIRAAMATTGTTDDSENKHANTPPPGSASQSASGVVPTGASLPMQAARARPSVPDATPAPNSAPIAPALPVGALTSEPPPPADVSTRQYLIASAIGVGVALILGVSLVFVWRATRPPADVAAAAPEAVQAPRPTEPAAILAAPTATAPAAVAPATGTAAGTAPLATAAEPTPAAADSATEAPIEIDSKPADTPKPADKPQRAHHPHDVIPANPY